MCFLLDSRLEADTVFVLDLALCSVRLMKDARYGWLVLVPRRTDLKEMFELAAKDQQQLMDEIISASKVVRNEFAPDKINIGALGNLVPQLHVHVIARTARDFAWPGPVWGAGTAKPYDQNSQTMLLDSLKTRFKSAKP